MKTARFIEKCIVKMLQQENFKTEIYFERYLMPNSVSINQYFS